MPKAASIKSSKSSKQAVRATKPAVAKVEKPKREPSAYNLFCKKHMKEWIAAHPGRAKEAMAHMALLWKDAPENPNRGKGPKAKRIKPASGSSELPSDY
ncbi:hypothetical protein D9756_003653 [Leucocoprinus leucothites]|uniref:HMG box domain-containing protein n=1 Tax=Leucocoprinus leucothites TaxID=201217 RepID=A0A8H5G7L5_9AGAR|nr:hypothetical protein D9756_003653 [Leucoagaricus leucothites]